MGKEERDKKEKYKENMLKAVYHAFGVSDEEGRKTFTNAVIDNFKEYDFFYHDLIREVIKTKEEGIFDVSDKTLEHAEFWSRYDRKKDVFENSDYPDHLIILREISEMEGLSQENREWVKLEIEFIERLLENRIMESKGYLKKRPEDGYEYNVWGLCLYLLGRYDEAIEKYELAYQNNPGNHVVHHNMGLAYYKKGEYEKAIEYANLDINKNNLAESKHAAGGWGLKGLSLFYLGYPEEAIKILREAREAKPDDSVIVKNLTFVLEKEGRHEELRRVIEEHFERRRKEAEK
jgi:tetratricopeptide (TPR) repeat protein